MHTQYLTSNGYRSDGDISVSLLAILNLLCNQVYGSHPLRRPNLPSIQLHGFPAKSDGHFESYKVHKVKINKKIEDGCFKEGSNCITHTFRGRIQWGFSQIHMEKLNEESLFLSSLFIHFSPFVFKFCLTFHIQFSLFIRLL